MFNRHRLVSCHSRTPTPEKDGIFYNLLPEFENIRNSGESRDILIEKEQKLLILKSNQKFQLYLGRTLNRMLDLNIAAVVSSDRV